MSSQIMKDSNPNLLEMVDDIDRSKWEWEDYVTYGQMVSQVKGLSQWILGKLAYEVCTERKYGEIADFARSVRQDPGSMRVYRRVYEKYIQADKSFVPDGFTPWGVLQVAAETDNPIQTLDELADKQATTIAEAVRHIKTKETGKQVPLKPKVSLHYDEEKNIWKITIAEEDLGKIDWSDIRQQLIRHLESI